MLLNFGWWFWQFLSLLKTELESRVSQNNIKVVVPHEAELAVVGGAVMFGHNVKAITSHVMKHTYGVDMDGTKI